MSNTIDDPKAPFVPNYLLYLLAAASEAASARFHSHVRTRGLRVPEWRVMACLTDTDGSMVTELARYAMIEQSRLTKIIIQMDKPAAWSPAAAIRPMAAACGSSSPRQGPRPRPGNWLTDARGPRTGTARIIPGRRRLRRSNTHCAPSSGTARG
jgi:hypothetical protein